MLQNMITKKVSKNESFSSDSGKFNVNGNQKYKATASVTGIQGNPYSAYFAVIMIDDREREIGRQIRWINDFTKNQKNYDLIFTTKPSSKYVVLGYRLNVETPVKSDLVLELQDPMNLALTESNDNSVFDDITKYEVPLLPLLTSNEEETLEKKIVWLCAPPRSGTTWLGTQLLNHKENIIWHEPWIGFHLGVLRGGLTPAKDFNDASPEGTSSGSSKKIPTVSYNFERILDMQADNGEYFFSPFHKNNWLPYLRKLILARTFSHCQTLNKNVIIKDPVGSNGMDVLSECLPNSKLLFLIRDGRDEVDSRMDMHSPNSWAKLRPFRTKKDQLQGLTYYSQLWTVNTENIKKGFDKHNPKLKLLIKYEDLKQETSTVLKKIYNFIGIQVADDDLQKLIKVHDFKNIPDSEKGKGKFTRSAKSGGWKTNFDKEEHDLMNSIMGKTLEKFSYRI